MILDRWIPIAAAAAPIYGAGYCWYERKSWRRSVITSGLVALAGRLLDAPFWVIAGLGLGVAGDFFCPDRGHRRFWLGWRHLP